MRRGLSGRGVAGHCIIAAVVCLCTPPPAADAELYECRDSTDRLVYTDRPAQLTQCTPMKPASSVSQVGPSAGVQAPIIHPEADVTAPPVPAALPAATGSPSPPGAVPCTPGINPLNPFSTQPCAPPLADTPPGFQPPRSP
jgi:hypothetical protein